MIELIKSYLGITEVTEGSPLEFMVALTGALLLIALVLTVFNILTSVFNNMFR